MFDSIGVVDHSVILKMTLGESGRGVQSGEHKVAQSTLTVTSLSQPGNAGTMELLCGACVKCTWRGRSGTV